MLSVLAAAGVALSRPGPTLVECAPVDRNIVALTVRNGEMVQAKEIPYKPEPGDTYQKWQPWGWGFVVRDGKTIGGRVGKQGELMRTFESIAGARANLFRDPKAAEFSVGSTRDRRFADGKVPVQLHYLRTVDPFVQVGPWNWEPLEKVTFFLVLPHDLKVGADYTVRWSRLDEQASFAFKPELNRSPAVNVNQVGFRPDDPLKVGFLSNWLGDGGAHEYREGMRFSVVPKGGGEAAFAGAVTLRKPVGEAEDDRGKNHSNTPIYEMDFSALSKPGRYVLVVEGIGCSYPFDIANDAWKRAFVTSARGFYHQRSGIAKTAPYTDWIKPRSFHPDDGVTVYHSTTPLQDSGNGLDWLDSDADNFGNLVKGKTDEVVPNAWGGYFDAGDWDRRIQHLRATYWQLQLAMDFRQFVAETPLNIPESANELPDLVDEALWNIDHYRRLQTSDGGIRGGVESAEHPLYGERSWQESLPVMAYAPGAWESYSYAATAGKAAQVLGRVDPVLANVYRESAVRAFDWAEAELPRLLAERKTAPSEVNNQRNLSALELYRLTGEDRFHRVFLDTTVFDEPRDYVAIWAEYDQSEAAWCYAEMKERPRDAEVLARVERTLRLASDRWVENSRRSAHGWSFRWPGGFVGWGSVTTARYELARAHQLFGDERYLEALIASTQFALGANPCGLSFCTGLGSAWPERPLVVDARWEEAPAGISLYGPLDLHTHDDWGTKMLKEALYPAYSEWPSTGTYFDWFFFASMSEYTIMETMGPNTYAWGYLAARP